jgi:V/A-type H+-transporting ATPase subunit C
VNIRTLLRLKDLGMDAAMTERYLIMGGAAFDEKQLRKLARTESLVALVAALKRTPYKDVFMRTGEDIVEAELELEKRLIRRSFLFTRQHPLTVMSILSYLLAKVTELRNLKTLVKAKQLGLEDEFIEQKLIVI